MTTHEAIEILTAEIEEIKNTGNNFDLWEALEKAIDALKKQENN